MKEITIDLHGLNPAPVTPFTRDGAMDYAACKKLGAWLAGIDGVKSLTVLGHAGEGTAVAVEEAKRAIHDRLLPLEAEEEIKAAIRAAELPHVG
ncbi:dihydrodipicolinate synthase family protein [Dickeya dadantii]|uniref:dihydrodipicolinate synthase family protein n=1 Tax=Dickeya dadantii TaxID=204038 RepID=UPI00384B76C7